MRYEPVAKRLLGLLSKISDSTIFREIRDNDRFLEILQEERAQGYQISKKEIINDFIGDRWNQLTSYLLENAKEYDGKLFIYRSITSKDPLSFGQALEDSVLTNGYKRLGIFWTWDFRTARSIWGDYSAGKQDVIITGLVDFEAINIKETVLANFNPTFGSKEQEITLKDGAPVVVTELSKRTIDGIYSIKRFKPPLGLTA